MISNYNANMEIEKSISPEDQLTADLKETSQSDQLIVYSFICFLSKWLLHVK